MKLIKNCTFYNGKIYLKFERYPHYSSYKDEFNKIHLNLGFTKLVSRIKIDDYQRYNLDILYNIERKTNLKLVTSYYDRNGQILKIKRGVDNQFKLNVEGDDVEITIEEINNDTGLVHFTTDENDYIGIDFAFMAYNNNMKATANPQVFEYYEKDKLVGYCGYSHRASVVFKIGDKIFEENWMPADNKESTRETTPFKQHGDKIIESLSDAFQAASNFADYVS
jgi:hypothetical protein